MRMHQILKELGVTRERVIGYCREKYPHLFHKETRVNLRTLEPTELEWCEVKFKALLLHYLSDHNMKVTGKFATELKGW